MVLLCSSSFSLTLPFDVPNAESEAEIQPDCVLDRIWREPVTLERNWPHSSPWIGPILGLEAETS
jgi:hypothetical protein